MINHTCPACGQVHNDAAEVTLIDGRVVSNYSEEWRAECEARYVTNLPTLERRRKYIEGVEAKRGKQAADVLRRDVRLVWLHEKKARA